MDDVSKRKKKEGDDDGDEIDDENDDDSHGDDTFSQGYMYAVCYDVGTGILTYNNYVYVFPQVITPDDNVPSVFEATNLASILYLLPF